MRLIGPSVLALSLLGASARAAPFSPSPHLDYSPTPERVSADCGRAKERAQSALAALASLPEGVRTFANTAEALDDIVWDLNDQTSADQFLKYVAVSSSVRGAAGDCETLIDQFGVETYSRPDLYAALFAYAATKPALDGEKKKLLDKELLEFKRNGLALPAAKREEVKTIKLRLAQLQSDFSRNLNEVKDSLLVARPELEGLSEDFVQGLKKEGEQYRVTLDYPDYFPFMNNAKSAKTRQLLEALFNDRAAAANLPILEEVLRLRHKAALLLGYPSHAAYVLEERMAKKPAAVMAFLERLQKKLKPLAQKELAVLRELKREQEGASSDGVLHAWDWRFYDNLLKKTRFDVDDEKVKEYFPADVVTEGLLAVYQKLLSVRFREVAGAAVWSPDVKLYEVADASGGEPFAYFYMDLYPREGKYKHAAAFTLIKARRLPDGGYQKPVSAIVANLAKPNPGHPALLKHSEVETFFHEFGHIMHQTLTRARYGRFSGSSVARDFVEAPSQMLEEWVWDPAVLATLSGHYQDKAKKLPKDLLEKMLAAKNADTGLVHLRQVFFASIDLRYHALDQIGDTTKEYAKLMEDISLIPMSFGTHPQASFGHLMGYDAGYYGYLWSKVFAEDMFSRFAAEGLLNPAIGRQYRETVLEQGSSKDEADILKTFLGRAPNEKAFLKSIGLTEK